MNKRPLNLKPKKVLNPLHPTPALQKPWRLLVADDEIEVHSVTKLILGKLHFQDRPVEILSAYSAKEALEILRKEEDIAVVLLDVVMETEDAGLILVEQIRNELANQAVRIILRTGQPGQAPEESVIVEYDINDYKSKSELTASKLMTATVSAFRAYYSIRSLEKTKEGLELILKSTDTLFEVESLQQFSSGVLKQLSAFLNSDPDGILCVETNSEEEILMQGYPCEGVRILGSSGAFKICKDCTGILNCKHNEILNVGRRALADKETKIENDYVALYLDVKGMAGSVALLHGVKSVEEDDMFLLKLFSSKISLALSNAIHYSKMISAEEAASYDYLTGLPNRRNLIDIGGKLIAGARRTKSPLTVAMLDIDFFKKINDTYGHDGGDGILRKLASFLKENLRESDLVARFGGEEFCLVLPNTGIDGAREFLDIIREKLSKELFDAAGNLINITASFGASSKLDDLEEMISAADKQLYNAKTDGRNRVETEE